MNSAVSPPRLGKGNVRERMVKRRISRVFAVAVLAACIGSDAVAASIEALQGAWTMNGTDCAATFEKVGDTIQYKDRTASVTTGIIVSGSRITGPNSTCTAQKIREEKDHFIAYLNCADAIMFDSFSVSFRIIDAQHFQRFDPQFPEAAVIYNKCEF